MSEQPKDLRDILQAGGGEAVREAVAKAEEVPSENSLNSRNPSLDQSFGSIGSFGGEDDGESSPPPFPVRCLPPDMARMVTETSRAVLAPECLPAAVALGVVSASIGAGLETPSGGDRRSRGNLYLLPIAESGTGKDASFGPVVKPLLDRESELVEAWETQVRPDLEAELELAHAEAKRANSDAAKAKDSLERGQHLEDLKEARRKIAEIEKRLAAAPVLVFTEPTREGLTETLSHQCEEAGACLTPESRGVLTVLRGRYASGSSDEDIYCMGWSGTGHAERRKNKSPVVLKRPCLTVLWMLQPDKARGLIGDETMTESGLLPRFLLFDSGADAEDMPETLPSINPETRERWGRLVRALVDTYRLREGEESLLVPLADGVLAEFREFDNETRRARRKRDGGQHADIAPFAARWAEQAWRLALVLHAAEHGAQAHHHPLEVDTARKAIGLARWFIDRQLAFLQGERIQRMRSRAEGLVTLLRKDYNGAANAGALKKRNFYTLPEVRQLAQAFPSLLKIEDYKPEGGGRPTERVSAI